MIKESLTKEERQQRRAARREKQRALNVLRAAKMHNLRLTAPLPRARSASRQPPLYNIGCSGWFYWHWKDIFYPENLPTKEWFSHYARSFKTVELNAPFYSWPTETTIKAWLKQAGRRNFFYTVKVCELITHTKKFTGTKELVKDFNYISQLLGNRMGCFLYQLPPSYHYSPARLRAIVTQLPNGVRNVVEFRHPSWWNTATYKAFEKANIIFCSCSAPRLPDELIKTADEIYIRFHGKKAWYRHNYSKEELKTWVERIEKANAQRVWVYFNNDRDGYAIANAKTLARLLKKKPTRG